MEEVPSEILEHILLPAQEKGKISSSRWFPSLVGQRGWSARVTGLVVREIARPDWETIDLEGIAEMMQRMEAQMVLRWREGVEEVKEELN